MKERWGDTIKSALNCSIALIGILAACTYDSIIPEIRDCGLGNLSIRVIGSQATLGCGLPNGIIEVSASGGVFPYRFALSGKSFQESTIFTTLYAGEHTLLVVDAKGCSDTLVYYLKNLESNLLFTANVLPDSGCLSEAKTGVIKISASNGVPPYQFRLGDEAFSTDSVFYNLKFGNYNLALKDASQCVYSMDITVPRLTSKVSWQEDVMPIIMTSCAKSGCHDGESGRVSLMNYENVELNANQIKQRVINRSMPFDAALPESQISLIVCWIEDGAPDN